MIEAANKRLGELIAEERDGCRAILDSLAWSQVFDRLTLQGHEYVQGVMAYHTQYISEKRHAFIPIPLVLTVQGKLVGVWPLHAVRDTGQWDLGSNSRGILEPALIADLGRNERKRLFRWCIQFLTSLGNVLGAKQLRFEVEESAGDLESWYWILLNSVNARIELKHHLYVDLTLPLDRIRSSVRKSYRPLISKAEKIWRAEILETVDPGAMEELRKFHIEVAGKETRSSSTWELQRLFINSGNGFMITVRTEGNRLAGGALFSHSRDACSYDVGVYDRSLFDLPIGHLIQMRAIEHAKSKGMSLYHIGQRPFAGSDPGVTEKEVHIGLFKQGFATHYGHRFHVTVPLTEVPT
jgi:FemAB family protein